MMDQYRIIITPVAGEEITAIHDWIAKDSPQNAARVVTKILDALELLKAFPHRTIVQIEAVELKYPMRSIAVRPYVIFFRVLDGEKIVRVLHVQHGARMLPIDFE